MRDVEKRIFTPLCFMLAFSLPVLAQETASDPVAIGNDGPGEDATVQGEFSDSELDALIDGGGFGAAAKQWSTEITVQGMAGYDDNVLRGPFLEQVSLFYGGSIDAFLWRLPAEGKFDFYTYLLAEAVVYPDVAEIDQEIIVLSQSKLGKKVTDRLNLGTVFQYTYADQVYDVSVSELDRDTTTLRFQQWGGRLSVERIFAGDFRILLDYNFKRVNFDDPADDYTAPSLKLSLKRPLGDNSKMIFSYEWGGKDYDERRQRDESGNTIAAAALRWTWQEFVFDIRQKFGENGKFGNSTKIFWKINRDNGSGYYNFDRFGVKEKVRYEFGKFELEFSAKVSRYEYDVQTVSSVDDTLYSRTDLSAKVRISRKIGEKFNFYGEYAWEQSLSMRSRDAYDQNRCLVGFERTF